MMAHESIATSSWVCDLFQHFRNPRSHFRNPSLHVTQRPACLKLFVLKIHLLLLLGA